jgi:hypothetical protein
LSPPRGSAKVGRVVTRSRTVRFLTWAACLLVAAGALAGVRRLVVRRRAAAIVARLAQTPLRPLEGRLTLPAADAAGTAGAAERRR